MFALDRQLTFAHARLAIECVDEPVVVESEAVFSPKLPIGMRIDSCIRDTLLIEVTQDEVFSIALETGPHRDWEGSFESGEALDAVVLSHRSGDVGAVAMRDPEWFRDTYGLQIIHAGCSGPRKLTATFKADASTKVVIQLACAWTNEPKNDQEALSPWFAVDAALQF